jgi:ankyrin repeat protein
MMASVVKNAVAAKILVEYLDASTTPKNATGMTALMCASRLRDEREGPLMATESASIVSLLLAYGADVNAAEFAGRQTALHFALLSNNLMVVEQLLTSAGFLYCATDISGDSLTIVFHFIDSQSLISTSRPATRPATRHWNSRAGSSSTD